MRVIAELNLTSLEMLPLDRLRRMQHISCNPFISNIDESKVGLFGDVGVILVKGF